MHNYDKGVISLIVKGVLKDGDAVSTMAEVKELGGVVAHREHALRQHVRKRQHFADSIDQIIWVSAYDIVDESNTGLIQHLKANLEEAKAVFPRMCMRFL